jgi:hypothetical protein
MYKLNGSKNWSKRGNLKKKEQECDQKRKEPQAK